MDVTDLKILEMLKKGVKIADIQKALKVSRQSVYYRIQKMKQEINLKDTVVADLDKLGYHSLVLVMVKWNLSKYEEIKKFGESTIATSPYVVSYFVLLGEWDAAIIFACKSQREYYEKVINGILMKAGDVVRTWQSIPITDVPHGNLVLPDVEKSLI